MPNHLYIWRRRTRHFVLAMVAGFLMLAGLAPFEGASADTFATLHEFCSQSRCKGGIIPTAAFILDREGNLFGSTPQGGLMNAICQAVEALDTPGCGVIFELTPNADKTTWTEHTVYKFCSQHKCADGFMPAGALTQDKEGNFYGTTTYGGANNLGVVFKLMPNADKTQWTETVLYNFCSASKCADGSVPGAGLLFDKLGNLYGTTIGGGTGDEVFDGDGTVFELSPNADKTEWTETVLYSFCSVQVPPSKCTDGSSPRTGLIADKDGNLYGTTSAYSTGILNLYGTGTVFELTPNQAKTGWTASILFKLGIYEAYQEPAPPCLQCGPVSGNLLIDDNGNLYGVIPGGPVSANCAPGLCGTAFELTANKPGTPWTFHDIHDFCLEPKCADGKQPEGGLIADEDGNLYGATSGGGSRAHGTVFELTHKKSRPKSPWSETLLHSFDRADASPNNPLVMDEGGNLYGATLGHAYSNTGVAFRLSP